MAVLDESPVNINNANISLSVDYDCIYVWWILMTLATGYRRC